MDELIWSKKIKSILPPNWHQEKENPNKFFNDRLEAIYVYDQYLKYFEDIRSHNSHNIINFPFDMDELLKIIE